jgi:DNA-binding cell septation regulator SpoVG
MRIRWSGGSKIRSTSFSAMQTQKSHLIDDVHFTLASLADRQRGLLGFVSFRFAGRLRLLGVAVRRSVDGRLHLSFPTRRDRLGRVHQIVHPVDSNTRREIEEQVFRALRLDFEVTVKS